MSVATLLEQSKSEHLAYRDALPRRVAHGSGTIPVAGDAEVAGMHLAAACRLRAEAHVLDPEQADPAWGDEAASHDHGALLDFYVEQLTRESEIVKKADDAEGVIGEVKRSRKPADPKPTEPKAADRETVR